MKYLAIALLVFTGCVTAPLPPEAPVEGVVTETPAPSFTFQPATTTAIVTVSAACSKYGWGNRGAAPIGFLAGVSLVGRQLSFPGIVGAPLGDPSLDSLAHYKSRFDALGIPLDTEANRVRATMLLLTGLGMRESSGNYLEGWDVSAKTHTEAGAEAGLFQTSYDALDGRPTLRSLYDFYRAHPDKCLVAQFKPGSYQPRGRNTTVIGHGDGAAFQTFTKECPAFATEVAAVMVRVDGGKTGHYGPIRRFEAELYKACYQ